MSAFIVSKSHIDLLVSAGLSFPTYGNLSWAMNAQYGLRRELTTDTADRVGRMLWLENLASVAFRYPNDKSGDRPGPIDFQDADIQSYRHATVPGKIDPVVVLKSISCYEYQSCERPAWHDSQAKQFCNALKDACINVLPGYDAAPWGID